VDRKIKEFWCNNKLETASVEHSIVLNGQVGFVRLLNNSAEAVTAAHNLNFSVDKHFAKDGNIVASEVTSKIAKYRGDTPNAPKIILTASILT
jgi:hypothetical protein